MRDGARAWMTSSRSVDRISVDDVILAHVRHLPRPHVDCAGGGLRRVVCGRTTSRVGRGRGVAGGRDGAGGAGGRQEREGVDGGAGELVELGVVVAPAGGRRSVVHRRLRRSRPRPILTHRLAPRLHASQLSLASLRGR